MAVSTVPIRRPLVGIAFWKENPGPPERPEWEGRGPGGNRWFFGMLGIFLAVFFLGRLLGPFGVVFLSVLGLVVIGATRGVKALIKRYKSKS